MVYLMYRADRGYRVGLTKNVRSDDSGNQSPGIRVRMNQEHADAAWVLRVCESRAEAAYWEAWFAATFGIPTAVFHGLGRRLTMDDPWIQQLYDSVDTETAAKQLMDELDLHPEFPHHRPQNGGRRQTLNLTMYSDRRGSNPVGLHRIQWSSNRDDVARTLVEAGIKLRAGRGGGYRYETVRRSYRDAVDLAKEVAGAGELEIRRRARIGDDTWMMTPLSHLRPGMRVLIERAGQLVPERVERVESSSYEGPVYDLEVDPTHTYVADGVLVHNSIYQFRGADIRNIVEFEQVFPDCTVVVLDQNYRSTQVILDAANAVIANNIGRKPKDLWTDRTQGDRIVRFQGEDEAVEAAWIVGEMASRHQQGDCRWGDIAVFFRTNAQSRVIEETLVGAGIPYKVIGGTRFYDRREIKDAVAYLRSIVNPADEVSLKRVINVPKRGVGDSSVAKIDAYASEHGLSFMAALRLYDEAGVSGRAIRGIDTFLGLVNELTEIVVQGPAAVLRRALEESGYLDELRAERSIEAEGRLENLAELIGSAEGFETVDEFLEQVSLVSDTDEIDDDESQVVLMTLHTAKGLEYPIVFITGMEDGIFPHMRSLGEPDQLEEERRLCYVGITRAMEQLHLTHAWSRTIYGTTQYNPPSRFLDEIPDELVDDRTPVLRSQARSSIRPTTSSGRTISTGDSEFALSARQEERRERRRDRSRDRMVEAALQAGQSRPNTGEPRVSIGDDVRHGKWGDGVVLDIVGHGDDAEVVVNFESVGEKRLLLSWAPLEVIK